MNNPNLASKRDCTGCLACVDSCVRSALSKIIGTDGHIYIQCDESQCVLCHKCEQVCPIVSNFSYNNSDISKSYAAWCIDEELRVNSASGGAFAAIADYVLDNKGIVIGAANVGVCDIRHIAIDNKNDLIKLQGSKYTQSDTSGSYRLTLEYLKKGKDVLYSGTGCQIAGVLSFLRQKVYKGRLITIDLICGGVPSKNLILKFIENEPYVVKRILSFRTKENGWKPHGFVYNMKVEDNEGRIHDYSNIRNLVTTGFSNELTERYSCYNCRFVGTHRMSDFTIGDLWGDRLYPDQHYKGLSLIVSHNHQAEKMLKDMSMYLQIAPCDSDSAQSVNFRLVRGKNARQYTLERILLSYLFSSCSYNTIKKIYAGSHSCLSIWTLWSLLRRVYIKILNKFLLLL